MLAAVSIPSLSQAAPQISYNPATGGIWMKNDTGASLSAFSVISAGNRVKTNPDLFTTIPGTIFDSGDLPLGFTYLNFPKTPADNSAGMFIGNVIAPGTPLADLSGLYYINFSNPGITIPGPPTLIPEPSSSLMACLAIMSLRAAASRAAVRRA